MKTKRILAVIIAAALLAAGVIGMGALASANLDLNDYSSEEKDAMLDEYIAPDFEDGYIAKSGVITEISEYDGIKRVVIAPSVTEYDGEVFVFMIDADTYFLAGELDNLEVGANVTGFFGAIGPMALIYPSQHNISYLAVGYDESEREAIINSFNENIATSGEYVTAVHPTLELTDEDRRMINEIFDGAVIKIDGEVIAHRAYLSETGYIMLPVRAVAEALGLEVLWFGDTRSVQVGMLSFMIDYDSYAFARMAPISLGQAPILRRVEEAASSLTFVPIDFFTSQYLGASVAGWSAEYSEEFGTQVITIIREWEFEETEIEEIDDLDNENATQNSEIEIL